MKKYLNPNIEIVKFSAQDVLTSSQVGGSGSGSGSGSGQGVPVQSEGGTYWY